MARPKRAAPSSRFGHRGRDLGNDYLAVAVPEIGDEDLVDACGK
jgi:hypothetical protein